MTTVIFLPSFDRISLAFVHDPFQGQSMGELQLAEGIIFGSPPYRPVAISPDSGDILSQQDSEDG